jgi:cell division protein FtsL
MSMYRDNLARPLKKSQESASYKQQQSSARSEQAKAQAREKLLWLATILVCIVVALGLVGRYASMVSLNYEVQEQKKQLQALQDERLKLEQQMLELQSAERIKSYAANKLGMKPVQPNQIIVLPGAKN